MSEQQYERISEIPEVKAESELVPLVELAGRDLLIQWVRPAKTRFGDALCVRYTDLESGEIGVFITSGVILTRKLQQVVELGHLPAIARFVKVGRCWDIE